ncbi:hypothetical protein JW859_05435 [bacterium]|nr:hypothetical protein [bacterium]
MRNAIIIIILIAAAGLLVLAGCNRLGEKAGERIAERAMERATGEKVDIDVNQDGGATITHTEDGSVTTLGADAKLPAGWPAEVPVYPGAELIAATEVNEEGNQGFHLGLKTADSGEDVLAFYRDKMAAAGYQEQQSMVKDGMGSIHFINDKWLLNVGVGREKGEETGIMLMLSTHDFAVSDATESTEAPAEDGEAPAEDGEASADGGSEGVTVSSGSLPADWPEVLKPYPGGSITQSMASGNEYVLIQTTTDNGKTVIAYYEENLKSRGWTVDTSVESGDNLMRGFTSSAGEIALTTSPADTGTAITLTYSKK